MTTPYTLDYGLLYAHELRRFRIDSRRSFKAFQRRKIAMCLPAIARSILNMTGRTRASAVSSVLITSVALATITQALA